MQSHAAVPQAWLAAEGLHFKSIPPSRKQETHVLLE